MRQNMLLKIAGISTFILAIFQAVITTVPSWALYFGAGKDIVSRLWLLLIAGYLVAVIFVVFGFYALSGAGVIRKLPLVRSGLLIIGLIFTIRGIFLLLELMINIGIIQSPAFIPLQEIFSSAVSLIIGIIYLLGTKKAWPDLQK